MFYSDAILSKKGPLAKVWLAAHERKLTKAQLLQTSIVRSTQAIVEQDEAPLALRLSGQLLLGVVRIYSRKARYLLDDCNEALMKIKLAFRPGNVDLPTAQTATSHALLTIPDTLTELDLLAPPDPTILLSQPLSVGARDTTLLATHAMDLSLEYPRGLLDEEDPLSQFPGEGDGVLDFALDDDNATSFSVERGRDAGSIGLEDEFGSIRGLDGDLDFGGGLEKGGAGDHDGLDGGFGDSGLDFGFGDDFNMQLNPPNDFADALLRPADAGDEEGAHTPPHALTTTPKLIRKRKLLTADSETEISKKDYSNHLKDTSHILRKQRFLSRYPTIMTLLEARIAGRLADQIFCPPTIHPDLRAMLNPESLRKLSKRKLPEHENQSTPSKKARIAALEEHGFDDGGFGDGGFGDGGFGDDSAAQPEPFAGDIRAPSVVSELPSEYLPETIEEEETPTSISGSMSASTVAAATLLQKEFSINASGNWATLGTLTKASVHGRGVAREEAVKMFFEVLVLASRDLVRVKQERGYGEIRVQGKEGLFSKFGPGGAAVAV